MLHGSMLPLSQQPQLANPYLSWSGRLFLIPDAGHGQRSAMMRLQTAPPRMTCGDEANRDFSSASTATTLTAGWHAAAPAEQPSPGGLMRCCTKDPSMKPWYGIGLLQPFIVSCHALLRAQEKGLSCTDSKLSDSWPEVQAVLPARLGGTLYTTCSGWVYGACSGGETGVRFGNSQMNAAQAQLHSCTVMMSASCR